MSRISKDLAHQIAVKLTEKSRIATDKFHTDFRTLVTETYEAQIPSDVKECFKKNSDWFYTSQTIELDGHGFRWKRIAGVRSVICNNGTNAKIKMTAAIGDMLTKSVRKYEAAKEKYEKLMAESEQALLTLKTFNNIRKELPEASKMLPPPMSNALVVNFTSLKSKLNNQPEVNVKTEKVKS